MDAARAMLVVASLGALLAVLRASGPALEVEPDARVVRPWAPALIDGRRLPLASADAGSLEALPGIGPRLAERVLGARAEAPFCELSELRRVPGIGSKTLARLQGALAVGYDSRCPRTGAGE